MSITLIWNNAIQTKCLVLYVLLRLLRRFSHVENSIKARKALLLFEERLRKLTISPTPIINPKYMTTATMSQTSKATPVLVSISDSVMILDRQKKMDVCYVLSTIDNMQAGVGCSFTRGLRSKTSCFLILAAPALTPGLQSKRIWIKNCQFF